MEAGIDFAPLALYRKSSAAGDPIEEMEYSMQVKFMSVMVKDQEKALKFYTKVLGFKKMADFPMGKYRWLTVVLPDGIKGTEVVLEPLGFPPAKVFQKELFKAGIPWTAFISKDIKKEYKKLKGRGVKFRGEPVQMGPIWSVLFEDTCGNLINLVQPVG
jgi:predicted enzyme related to lactoylglutathione lyase